LAIAFTVEGEHDLGSGLFLVRGSVVFSSTYSTGGDDLAADFPTVHSGGSAALFLHVQGMAGYIYAYDRGANTLLVFEAAADGGPLDQLGAGAYPAGITGDDVEFFGLFRKFVP
jgi:hypothetical protein